MFEVYLMAELQWWMRAYGFAMQGKVPVYLCPADKCEVIKPGSLNAQYDVKLDCFQRQNSSKPVVRLNFDKLLKSVHNFQSTTSFSVYKLVKRKVVIMI